MIKDFEGKVAVVTGATSGIGRSLATAFANRGMKVILADINKEALEEVAQELGKISNEVLLKVTDVSDRNQVAELADFSYDTFESVNILCNNAGVCHSAPIRLLSLEDWDWVLGVNFYGVLYGVHFFLNRMLESDNPCHIVNTFSDFGLGAGSLAPYSITKHAIIALSESLYGELSKTNVGVSVLCPGWVKTDLLKNTEHLGQQRSGVLELTSEIFESLNLSKERIENGFRTGVEPDFIAEKVIKAIEEDIFYIITPSEIIQSAKARIDLMNENTARLDRS
ncbi:MAG: SDR family NAD(P)-dependent oxidoreductase [Candidatus Thorarchaeota archaeon SMTZ1-45]